MNDNNFRFESCEQYVLAMLEDVQNNNRELIEINKKLLINESIINLLKEYVCMDADTGLMYCSIIIPSGPVREALAKIFTKPVPSSITSSINSQNEHLEEEVPTKKTLPKSPNAGMKNIKKIIPQKPSKEIVDQKDKESIPGLPGVSMEEI